MKEKYLSESLGNTLNEEFIPLVSDLAEVGLDTIMEEGVLRDIPFISTVVALYKVGTSFRERHNLKKLAVFIKELNKGIADNVQRWDYINEFKCNEKIRNQEIEYLLVLIDRYISYDKPQMLAKLYLAYLDRKLIWEELTMYAEIIDRFLLTDSRTLIDCDGEIIVHRNIGGESVLRLEALGLMTETNESSIFQQTSSGFGITSASMERFSSNDKTYRRTEFGDKLAEILKQKNI